METKHKMKNEQKVKSFKLICRDVSHPAGNTTHCCYGK